MGINDVGNVVGVFRDSKNGMDHGFLLSGGTFTSIDFPGASLTHALSIDPTGEIFGGYCSVGNSCYAPGENVHGFLLSQGIFTPIDFPGAIFTGVWGKGRTNCGKISGRERAVPYLPAEQRQLYFNRFSGGGRNRAGFEVVRWWDQCGRRHCKQLLHYGALYESVAERHWLSAACC